MKAGKVRTASLPARVTCTVDSVTYSHISERATAFVLGDDIERIGLVRAMATKLQNRSWCLEMARGSGA
jgi:hypothetical protein